MSALKLRPYFQSHTVVVLTSIPLRTILHSLSQSGSFDQFALTRISRSDNAQADALATLASSSDPGLGRVIPVEFIKHPSIGPPVIINLIDSPGGDDDETNVQTTQVSGLSKYGFDKPWMEAILAYIADRKLPAEKWPLINCIEEEKVRKILEEVHSGSCGNHSGGRSLAIKIKRHRHFWATIIKDCKIFARKCKKSESYARIKDAQVECFVWRNIICKHGVPYEIVADNGSQFISTRFEAFCEKWKIRLNMSTQKYPECNGQAKSTNKTVLDRLKKRLDAKKVECMIPAEVEFPGVRKRLLPEREDSKNLMLFDELDLINKHREQALNYQHAAAKYFNANVHSRIFREGELVLRKVFQNTAERNEGKFGANWERPYKVIKVVRPGSYEIANMQDVKIPRT
ncbi:hypothetical protein N665_0353s0003 [Sinapis alba]|nr:hypothetical protein N665_0353s0003 [Sinapis alba]